MENFLAMISRIPDARFVIVSSHPLFLLIVGISAPMNEIKQDCEDSKSYSTAADLELGQVLQKDCTLEELVFRSLFQTERLQSQKRHHSHSKCVSH